MPTYFIMKLELEPPFYLHDNPLIVLNVSISNNWTDAIDMN